MHNINGVLFLDKISGISSAFLLRQVKILFQARKIGHTGTLDPLATGMLPICFGEATKLSKYLLQESKSYRVCAKLGERTDTFDSLGRVVCIRSVELTEDYLNQVLNTFIGVNHQVPPMFSAVKYYGYPLYYYARRGIDIVRKSRAVNIYKITIIQWEGEYIELEVFCSSGTYIRAFIDDFGESLGCGAHVVSLRRCSIANFSSKIMVNFSTLQNYFKNSQSGLEYLRKINSLLYPIDILVNRFPEINVTLQIYRLLLFGQKINIRKIFYIDDKKNDISGKDINSLLVRMTFGNKRRFFGIGYIDGQYLSVRRLVYS